MKPVLGIPDQDLQEITMLLNTLLADEYFLYTKTRNAHWNVEGPNFYELHKLFDTQIHELDEIIDDIAERVRSLGHFALGSLKDFQSVTHMTEDNHSFDKANSIIHTLVNDHEIIVRIIRNDIVPISEKYKDLGTADFVTGIMEQHEKIAWMLRSSLD
ncbi:MAG: DNA starvation/stationary phase protection protein [Bacteroidetes bacterium GWF2_38_335]|nr:MAG: DNA starvation/stationary phase protection protein [Bacteroidetes bacterium GWF2_38_335]OFY78954.1 MAG: DNA starvation/stationary phase protection protein [Bacteroidetes bacterium RIFOXYA12_FULL_38_20]HBS86024.1 DNA starvation/stationary phase protection protein [Bacteroidales bacterium]